MKNKILSLVLAAAVMLSGMLTVHAAQDTKISFDIQISGRDVTVQVRTAPAVTETKTLVISASADPAKIIKFEEFPKAASIDFAFRLEPDTPFGKYTVAVGGKSLPEEAAKRTAYFVYTDTELAAKKLAELNALDREAFEASIKENNGVVWVLDFEAEAYLNHAQQVTDLLFAQRKEGFQSAGDLERAYQRACMAVELSHSQGGAAEGLLRLYHTQFGISLDGDFEAHTAEVAKAFENSMAGRTITSVDEIAVIFHEACAVGTVNASARTEVIQTLKRYNDVFQLDFNGKFAKVEEAEIAKAMAGRAFSTVSAVQNAFLNRVDELYAALPGKDKPSNSRPGGGGGGTGGMSVDSGSVPVVDKEVMDEISNAEIKETFSDLSDSVWAIPYIRQVYENGIMSGDPDGRFRPEDSVTREEFTKIVLAAFGIEPEDAKHGFQDVEPGAWYESYVAAAARLGIIQGLETDRFATGLPVSRQDASVILSRVLALQQKELPAAVEEQRFSDEAEIASYAEAAVQEMQAGGVINGMEDGSFRPKANLTRAEAAKVIWSMLSNMTEQQEGGKELV